VEKPTDSHHIVLVPPEELEGVELLDYAKSKFQEHRC
jgi:hypothetical protein